MVEICDDPECPCYGKPFVDRGWGYPVCQSTRWFSTVYPGSEDKPLQKQWKNDVVTEEIHAHTTERPD
jgi:hypothetical protein